MNREHQGLIFELGSFMMVVWFIGFFILDINDAWNSPFRSIGTVFIAVSTMDWFKDKLRKKK